jgi:hypothetical protein
LVRLTVRTFTLAAVAVTLLTAPALADDDIDGDDEDAMYEPVPKRSVALGLQAHGSRIGGRYENGFGPSLELALGRGRWQYLIEGSASTARVEEVVGTVVRGALGARWVARQFAFDSAGALELLLLGTVGLERYSFNGSTVDGQLVRPELGVGFGFQGRAFRKPRLAFRIDVRALFTPSTRESSVTSCQSNCMTASGTTTGVLSGVTVSW